MASRNELAPEYSFDVCLEGSYGEFVTAEDFYANVMDGTASEDSDVSQRTTPTSIPYGMENLLLSAILAGIDRDRIPVGFLQGDKRSATTKVPLSALGQGLPNTLSRVPRITLHPDPQHPTRQLRLVPAIIP